MTVFPAFHSIDTLSIDFASSNSRNATIYGNGKNQVAVVVKLSLLDRENKVVPVDESTLRDAVYLCDYHTGDKISTNGTADYFYSKEENEYCNAISYVVLETENNKHKTVKLYVSANGIRDGKVISCGINVAGIGDIDTSEDGTTNQLPNGSTYLHQNSVNVKSLAKIDYGDRRNITISAGEFVTLSTELGWTSRLGTEGPYNGQCNGTSKRAIIYIQPNLNSTGQHKFKKHEIIYKPIQNSDVSTKKILWYGTEEDCFDLFEDSHGKPCAVIGNGFSNPKYHVNLWFSRQNHVRIDGHVYFEDETSYYRFSPKADENHIGDDEHGSATLLLYKCIVPESDFEQYGWRDVIRPVTVNVTDYYGNNGSFELTFNDKDHFDIPGIK